MPQPSEKTTSPTAAAFAARQRFLQQDERGRWVRKRLPTAEEYEAASRIPEVTVQPPSSQIEQEELPEISSNEDSLESLPELNDEDDRSPTYILSPAVYSPNETLLRRQNSVRRTYKWVSPPIPQSRFPHKNPYQRMYDPERSPSPSSLYSREEDKPQNPYERTYQRDESPSPPSVPSSRGWSPAAVLGEPSDYVGARASAKDGGRAVKNKHNTTNTGSRTGSARKTSPPSKATAQPSTIAGPRYSTISPEAASSSAIRPRHQGQVHKRSRWRDIKSIYRKGPPGEGQVFGNFLKAKFGKDPEKEKPYQSQTAFPSLFEDSGHGNEMTQPARPPSDRGGDSDKSRSGRTYKTHDFGDIALQIARSSIENKGSDMSVTQKAKIDQESRRPSVPEKDIKESSRAQQDSLVQTQLSRSKTLPPVPRLDPAPKSRRDRAATEQFITYEELKAAQEAGLRAHERSAEHRRKVSFFTLLKARLKLYTPMMNEWIVQRDRTRKQHKLKTKISSPRPLLSTNGRTCNIASESGGVGGLAAARSLPVKRYDYPKSTKQPQGAKAAPQRPKRQDEAPKKTVNEYQKMPVYSLKDDPNWSEDQVTQMGDLLGKFPRDIPSIASSEATFHCVGLSREHPSKQPPQKAEKNAGNRSRPLPRAAHQPTHGKHSKETDKPNNRYDAYPPDRKLSSSSASINRRDETRIDTEDARDSVFYQPYDDVLRSYQASSYQGSSYRG